MSHPHLNRRHAVYQRSGSGCDFISFLAQQWEAYDRAHQISVHDRAFSLVTYAQHQDAFTAWLEGRFPVVEVAR